MPLLEAYNFQGHISIITSHLVLSWCVSVFPSLNLLWAQLYLLFCAEYLVWERNPSCFFFLKNSGRHWVDVRCFTIFFDSPKTLITPFSKTENSLLAILFVHTHQLPSAECGICELPRPHWLHVKILLSFMQRWGEHSSFFRIWCRMQIHGTLKQIGFYLAKSLKYYETQFTIISGNMQKKKKNTKKTLNYPLHPLH